MTRVRIPVDARCEDPLDPKWRRVFEPSPVEVPELDLPERTSGTYPTKEEIARMSPHERVVCRIRLLKRRAEGGSR